MLRNQGRRSRGRLILANIGVHVVPMQAAVGMHSKAFTADGGFTDERTGRFFDSVIELLVRTCDRLRG
ncbi:MAG: hypothetical protein H6813_01015 [Phycisphaeraceae bacterium]|nr:hypothetical protein [Phycisphaeraceae bacterium]MCB9847333.1 hypothetical protein [Phycisphaeraceae bacterium]